MSRNWKHETETEMTSIKIIVSVNCIADVFLNCVNPDKMSIMWLVSMLVSLCQLQSVLCFCYLISSLESHCIVCPVSLSLPLHPSISFPLLITAAVSLLCWHRHESCMMQDCLLRYSIHLLYLPQTAACSSFIIADTL